MSVGTGVPMPPATRVLSQAAEALAASGGPGDDAAHAVAAVHGGAACDAGAMRLTLIAVAISMVALLVSEALARRTFDLFPDAGRREGIRYWAGLRPATPSNVPLIGRTRYANLFLNTGHGTLGWTMACGSGRALADVIARRTPEVDFAFTGR